jgi:hypothetical protein
MTAIFIPFYPKHTELETEEEHEALIAKYREWLDTHGRYGKLYMLNQGKAGPLCKFREAHQTIVNGLNIYEPEIATLFKLMFEV